MTSIPRLRKGQVHLDRGKLVRKDEKMSWIEDSDSDCILTVRVVPRASRNTIVGLLGDSLKIRLQAPPVDGKANKALVGLLSKKLGVQRSRIKIDAGTASRDKRIRIEGSSAAHVQAQLRLAPTGDTSS